jgi:tetratricopeptide (TPR) repeat protein
MSNALRTFPLAHRTRAWLFCAAVCPFAAWVVAMPLSAQGAPPFVATLTQLAIALGGSYGDEGAQVTRLLDAMERSLPDWDRELAAVEQRARASGADRQSHVDLARVYFERGRFPDAISELDAAARLDPKSLESSLMLGLAQANSGRRSEAAQTFRSAWQRHGSSPVAAYWLVLNDAGPSADELSAALDALGGATRAALTRNTTGGVPPFASFPTPPADAGDAPLLLPARYEQAYARLRAGDPAAALAEFRQASRRDPLVADAAIGSPALTAGSAALRKGQISVAREQFQHAITATPGSSEAHRLLAIACLFDFDPDASIAELRKAISLRPDDERSLVLLSRVLTQQSDLEGAAALLRAATTALPDSSLVRLWLGTVMVSSNRGDEAAQWLAEAAAHHPLAGEARLWSTIGALRHNTGDLDGAADAFARSIALNPNAAETHVRAARLYLDQEKRDQAFAEYTAALIVDAQEPNALMGIGKLHLDAGRYGEAIPVLQRLVALQPSFTEAHYALGTALTRAGRADDGRRELEAFTRAQAQAAEERRRTLAVDVLKQEAIVRTADGALDRAETVWNEILQLEPNVAANHAALGAVLVRANRFDAAAAAYERAAALGGGPDVYRQLVSIYARLGRQAESRAARQKFEQALAAPLPGTGR